MTDPPRGTNASSNSNPKHATDTNPSRAVHHVNPNAILEATNVESVREALARLHKSEAIISAQLSTLLSSQADLSRELGRLDLLRSTLGTQLLNTRQISTSMLSGAASTAGNLSSKVRGLDLEKERVEATLRVVEQVAELKACVNGVVGSMGAPQDWEAAAGYISRADRIPEAIIRGDFAASIVPSVEVPDPPWVTLDQARESLCGLFLREFEKAASENDGAKVTRFFKLFPLIGRGDTGLDVYGRYVCQGVAGTARAVLKGAKTSEGQIFYPGALTRLFEHVARIVDGHGGLVERHYGEGKMVRVIERLQAEVDVQGGIIVDTWSDERRVDRQLTDVKSYPFSFLVQSFVNNQRGMAATSRTASPALGQTAQNPRSSEDEGVNMKEVDALLNEIANMLAHWALYSRFLAGKCMAPDAPRDVALVIPDLLTKSNLSRKVTAKLATPYNVLSMFFFRRSVEKAFQLDEMPSDLSLSMNKTIKSNPPFILQAVDTVMYMVKTVIDKSISTNQRDVAASVIPTVSRVLGADFVGMIQRKMRDESYPQPLVQGGLPPEDKVIGFIVLINSLDTANEYLSRIITGTLGEDSEPQSKPANGSRPGTANGGSSGASDDPMARLKAAFPFGKDCEFVMNALRTLETSFVTKTTELMNDGLNLLFGQVVKARLRPVVSDAFRDADYSLSEQELEELAQLDDGDGGEDSGAVDDVVGRRFEAGWSTVMKPLARIMTPRTYGSVLDNTARHLARVLERRVWNYSGRANALGTVRMERDFGAVIGVISRGNYGLKELFTRTAQILMVANMEVDEWEELGGEGAPSEEDGGIEWVLSLEERKKARGLVKG